MTRLRKALPANRTSAAALVVALLWPLAAIGAGTPAGQDTRTSVAPASTAATMAIPPAVAQPASAPKAASVEATHPSDVQRFCQNVAAAAAEARNAWQVKRLQDLQGQVEKTIHDLEAKQAELKEVLAHREEALKKADATLVAIFAKMKPDTAAAQIAGLDDDIAAALLQQLNPRVASAILDEISPERAVRLVNSIAGTAPADGKKS